MKTYRSNYDAAKVVKAKFPKSNSVVVAAFGISHNYYEGDKQDKLIAKTLYTDKKNDTFVGVELELRFENFI